MDCGHGLTTEGFGGDDGGSVVCSYCYRVEDKINVVLNNALTQKVCTTKHLNATLCTLGKLSWTWNGTGGQTSKPHLYLQIISAVDLNLYPLMIRNSSNKIAKAMHAQPMKTTNLRHEESLHISRHSEIFAIETNSLSTCYTIYERHAKSSSVNNTIKEDSHCFHSVHSSAPPAPLPQEVGLALIPQPFCILLAPLDVVNG